MEPLAEIKKQICEICLLMRQPTFSLMREKGRKVSYHYRKSKKVGRVPKNDNYKTILKSIWKIFLL